MEKFKRIILSRRTVVLVISIIVLILLGSRDYLTKQWQQFELNREFVCPESQTPDKAEAYLYKFTEFYMSNYPNMTFQDFLSRRMQLLVSNNCSTTLQNLANDNNDALPDQNSVNELKNAPYDKSTNPTLKELPAYLSK